MPDAVSLGTQATYNAATSVDRGDQMGKDVFLKLLVAQMKYQDPANPASSSEFMAQTATFSQVEKLEEIAAQNAAMLVLQEASTAGSMVGRTVTWTDSDGSSKSGTVSSVRLAQADQEAVALVGGVEVPVGRITEITQS
jgi:flagellar basal-body rod modification protein FlgD